MDHLRFADLKRKKEQRNTLKTMVQKQMNTANEKGKRLKNSLDRHTRRCCLSTHLETIITFSPFLNWLIATGSPNAWLTISGLCV